jgi:hypothetical protein
MGGKRTITCEFKHAASGEGEKIRHSIGGDEAFGLNHDGTPIPSTSL